MIKLVLHPSFGWYLNHIQSHIFYHSNNQSQIEYESWLLSFCTPGKARSANALSSVLHLLNEHQQHRVMGFVVQTFLLSCCLFGSAVIVILRLSFISNFPHPLFPGSLIFWFPTCLLSYIPSSIYSPKPPKYNLARFMSYLCQLRWEFCVVTEL